MSVPRVLPTAFARTGQHRSHSSELASGCKQLEIATSGSATAEFVAADTFDKVVWENACCFSSRALHNISDLGREWDSRP